MHNVFLTNGYGQHEQTEKYVVACDREDEYVAGWIRFACSNYRIERNECSEASGCIKLETNNLPNAKSKNFERQVIQVIINFNFNYNDDFSEYTVQHVQQILREVTHGHVHTFICIAAARTVTRYVVFLLAFRTDVHLVIPS